MAKYSTISVLTTYPAKIINTGEIIGIMCALCVEKNIIKKSWVENYVKNNEVFVLLCFARGRSMDWVHTK